MARHLARLALLALAVLTTGCDKNGGKAPMVVVIGDLPKKLALSDAGVTGSASAVLRSATAQGLVRLDPAGQIEPGLAERWNVSDDGLSYIFRLESGDWPDGTPIRARDVARMLTRMVRSHDADPVRDSAGAVDEIVAMTDRVIEIRLKAPRPNLLTLLAQPEFALIHDSSGSGPFVFTPDEEGGAKLTYRAPSFDGEPGERQTVRLAAMAAGPAIKAFVEGRASLVLGGTVIDLPLTRKASLPRGALQFDPAAGLFGLVPARKSPLTESTAARMALNEAIDRQALLAALSVPGLGPRATLLEGGLVGIPQPAQPAWLGQPLAERRDGLAARLGPLLPADGKTARPVVKLWVPEGPGGDMIVARLAIDWGALGLTVERATSERAADFRFIDEVAPSDSPAWYVRRFRCDVVPVCDEDVDRLADEARATLLPEARAGFLALAAQRIDSEALFMPIAAPIRWSLVGKAVPGFVPNRYARHSLLGLKANPERVQ